MSWPKVRLNEICETQYGYTASATDKPVGPRFLRITDIVNDSINWSTVPYCKINDNEFDKYLLKVGDIVVARTGATTGYAKLIRDDMNAVFASYLVRLRLDEDLACPGFVGRVLESSTYKAFVEKIKGGAAQPNANAKSLTLFKFRLPGLTIQETIAEILSGYDDLIENNRRRIGLLEEVAREFYREWFVRFRFPGNESVKIKNGVPEGWSEGVVADFYQTSSGGTPSRKRSEYYTGNIVWVKTQELQNSYIFETDEKITEEAVSNSSAKLFPRYTVLVAMYGATIGQAGILAKPGCSNQACCALLPKADGANYIHAFLFVLENRIGLVNLGQGAAQNNISQDVIKNYPMIFPSSELMTKFIQNFLPVFQQIENLATQIVQLGKVRDLLLRKLMSGEITL